MHPAVLVRRIVGDKTVLREHERQSFGSGLLLGVRMPCQFPHVDANCRGGSIRDAVRTASQKSAAHSDTGIDLACKARGNYDLSKPGVDYELIDPSLR